MNCRTFKKNFEDYLENGLDFTGRFGMERHAEQCLRCGRMLTDARRLHEMAVGLQRVKAPDDFEAAVCDKVVAGKSAGYISRIRQWGIRSFELPALRPLAAAASGFAILGLGLYIGLRHDSENPELRAAMVSESAALKPNLPEAVAVKPAQFQTARGKSSLREPMLSQPMKREKAIPESAIPESALVAAVPPVDIRIADTVSFRSQPAPAHLNLPESSPIERNPVRATQLQLPPPEFARVRKDPLRTSKEDSLAGEDLFRTREVPSRMRTMHMQENVAFMPDRMETGRLPVSSFPLPQEFYEMETVNYLLVGPERHPLPNRLPEKLYLKYGQVSEEYFLRNVSH